MKGIWCLDKLMLFSCCHMYNYYIYLLYLYTSVQSFELSIVLNIKCLR